MDWQSELIGSFAWLVKALMIACVLLFGFALSIKNTRFGQQFWLITKPCLNRSNTIKAIGMVVVLVFFVLLEVRISVLNTIFYNQLYSSLQDMNAKVFWFFAVLNASLVIFKVIQEIIDSLIGQVFEIKWLEQLNGVMLTRWLANKNYYRLQYNQTLPDNIDQRIEQDARELITSTVDMVRGVMNAIVSTIEFTIILWGLSGILSVFGLHIPKGVVFFIYAFIILATAVSVWIGKPLIKLNFDKERLHGDYRYSLIRVRDNAESIAFYHGENQENQHLSRRFGAIITNRWAIIRRTLGLDGFNTGVTQIAMLLPLMLQAPRFFAGQIKLGDMHQTVQSFNRLMRALSFFRLFYEEFTLYQARLNRLHGFLYTLDNLDNKTLHTPSHQDNQLCLVDFGLKNVDGETLLSGVNICLSAGDALLIQGLSGAGKTTLLKAMAGIYPFEILGHARTPKDGKVMFLPQRPYMPEGSLRHAICYPDIATNDDNLIMIMRLCCLDKYVGALDDVNDWQAVLSPGELQRVAFIRALLSKPAVIFLDETTSALDEPTEDVLYTNIRTYLPRCIMVSVGHRNTLQKYHNKLLMLESRLGQES
ncbi:MAG: ABC transporter ATP-binding protein/permease [Moraxella sp.]|nr:ABC transporter ATP-binding protein/permease [Moraxella sp.]